MRVDIGRAAAAAWARTRALLLAPFSLERWIVVGFAAWLANLAGSSPGNIGWNLDGANDGDSVAEGVEEGLEALREGVAAVAAWEAWVLALLTVGLVVGLAIGVVLLWISSRGQFVFLDDVVRGEAAIVEPWRRWGSLGDSLFLFRLAFLALVLLMVAGLVILFVLSALSVEHPAWLLLWLPVLLLFVLSAVSVDVLLRHFVVPVMMCRGVTVTAAWRTVGALLQSQPGVFVVYLLLLVVLWMLVAFAVTALGLLTCCLGFLLLALPYVGTVVLLPLHVFLRAVGPEVLRQMDPELDLWGGAGATAG